MMLDLGMNALPKNLNGIRTTHTCELCGFEPKTKNKYREKQDHLVMKHFKDKIDKIFPHSRPYTCPNENCDFTGKDKQALLRHYTGKHGVLEKYLRDALAEKGIQYTPGEHGGKRRCSTSSDGSSSKQIRLTEVPTMIDAKDLLPTSPLPMHTRPSTEELRKEVEALMASFEPQLVLPLTSNTQIVSQSESQVLGGNQMPIKIELPNQPTNLSVVSTASAMPVNIMGSTGRPLGSSASCLTITPTFNITMPTANSNTLTSSTPSIIFSSNPSFSTNNGTVSLPSISSPIILTTNSQSQIRLPSLITTMSANKNMTQTSRQQTSVMGPSMSGVPIPLEQLLGNSNGAVSTSSSNSLPPLIVSSSATMNGDSSILNNDAVMWGGGPSVVVEAADTVPITYIETADGTYATTLGNVDYEGLLPGQISVDMVRERQLDFCML